MSFVRFEVGLRLVQPVDHAQKGHLLDGRRVEVAAEN